MRNIITIADLHARTQSKEHPIRGEYYQIFRQSKIIGFSVATAQLRVSDCINRIVPYENQGERELVH